MTELRDTMHKAKDAFSFLSVALLLTATILTGHVETKRILLMPFPYSSHVSELKHLGLAMQDKGHEVYMFMTKSYPAPDIEKIEESGIKMILHANPDPDYLSGWSQDDSDDLLREMMSLDCIDDFRMHVDGFKEVCSNALGDDEVIGKIKALNFDLILVDIFPSSRCFMVIVHKLKVPFIGVTTAYEPWLFRNPALPSFVPFNWGAGHYTEIMNFWERLDNLWTILDYAIWPQVEYLEQHFIDKYLPEEDKGLSLDKMVGRAELYFIDSDIAIDYPRPSMPNEVMIGGLTTGPSKALPEDLDKFISEAKKGIVLVSFGSYGGNLPGDISSKLMKAFALLEQRVIWRYPHSPPSNIPSNVKLMDWMPQNDILGHNNTKAFVTHCGANGQFEGIYHAVPMVNFPLFGEQPNNARRAEYKGIAITMSLLDFEPEELVKNIKKVIEDPSFKQSAIRVSKIFKSHPMKPTERAVYWMEHILQFGGKHLRSYALEMPWCQYLMLDIFGFLFVVSSVLLYIAVRVFKCILGKVFRNKEKIQ